MGFSSTEELEKIITRSADGVSIADRENSLTMQYDRLLKNASNEVKLFA